MIVKNRLANKRSDKQNTAGRARDTATSTRRPPNVKDYFVEAEEKTAPTQLVASVVTPQANHIRIVPKPTT